MAGLARFRAAMGCRGVERFCLLFLFWERARGPLGASPVSGRAGLRRKPSVSDLLREVVFAADFVDEV